MSGIDEKVEGGESRGHKTSPPPVVILSGKMEVTQENRGFGTSDDQNNGNEEKEAEHVVDLVGPERVEDEKQLNEDAAKWQDAAHDDAGNRSSVENLLRNVSWNWICSH